MLGPFAATAGPKDAKILIVGEAWGESEAQVHKPFVGESGKELWRMLGEAWPDLAPESHAAASELHKYGALAWVQKRERWLESAKLAYTNVLALQPPNNKLDALCVSKKEAEALQAGYNWPSLSQGKYLLPEYLLELDRLDAEIDAMRPNLIICAGNAACWAILRETNIGAIRGTIRQSRMIAGRQYKVLPTYHPAAIMRQWSWRVEVIADFIKARLEAETPDITRPSRQCLITPTLAEVEAWTNATLANPPPLVACDTETSRGQITMIGFARAIDDALLIPFVNQWPDAKLMLSRGLAGVNSPFNYWPEPWQEERAIEMAEAILASDIVKVFQNGMYDFQYLMKLGIKMRNCHEDTMLLHHSILPEMRKGLGYLGAAYTREPAWKLMRLQKADTEKRDE